MVFPGLLLITTVTSCKVPSVFGAREDRWQIGLSHPRGQLAPFQAPRELALYPRTLMPSGCDMPDPPPATVLDSYYKSPIPIAVQIARAMRYNALQCATMRTPMHTTANGCGNQQSTPSNAHQCAQGGRNQSRKAYHPPRKSTNHRNPHKCAHSRNCFAHRRCYEN